MEKDTDASEWLLDESAAPAEPAAPPVPRPGPVPRQAARPSSVPGLDPQIAPLREEIEGANKVLESLMLKVEALERRVAEEPAPPEPDAEPERERAQPTDEVEEAASAAPADGSAERDVNRVTFEDLRALGLSVSQTARLISVRQAKGGFKSIDELDELPGFPRQQLANLKRTLTIH